MIDEREFERLASAGFERVGLAVDVLADLETPLSAYLKLTARTGTTNSFLLESVWGGERRGRYSVIGLPARTVLRVRGRRTEVVEDGQVVETSEGDPLVALEQRQARTRVAVPPGLPRFGGGLAGYFSYDTVRHIEPRLAHSQPSGGLDTPDILLLECNELAVIDNLKGRLHLIVYADVREPGAYDRATERLNELLALLRTSAVPPTLAPLSPQPTQRLFEREAYLAAVRRAKEYISAGDLMQVQLGQRLSKVFEGAPLSLYRALRALNPSPYMYFYDFGSFQVVGASPEILVRQENGTEGHKVTIRPLAGTRPRGADPEQDALLEKELRADVKERAEHLMLIDLARNDIGRIARIGSVKVTEAFSVERYSHVMHIVSNVEGLLREGVSNFDVLRATFPAGTLTGAPKIRAMELIDELEPVGRGIYGGACGYLSYGGDMDLAISIRTGIIQGGILYVQASAGIVSDSSPEAEWKETEAKAQALLHASELVERGQW